MSNRAADKSAGTKANPSQNNNWNAVQNLLGFLLAGFGAVLSFIGLRSTEVTTVLRNYPDQASLIALFLLLGVLAAVLTVATELPSTERTSLPITAAIFLALFGVGALITFYIPTGSSSYIPTGSSSDKLSLVIGLSSVLAGIAILVPNIIAQSRTRTHTSRHHWLLDPIVPFSVIFILTSVIFIAISTYGAMRLETDSQGSFDAQVVASVSMNGPDETVSAHVTASRLKNNNYIGITVRGLPHKITLAAACEKVKEAKEKAAAAAKGKAEAEAKAEISNDFINCLDTPCYWLFSIRDSCPTVMAATIAPNDNGDVDETLNTPLSVGQFQDIHVQAVICSHIVNSCFPLNTSGSQVDLFVPTSETSGSR